MNLLMVGVDNLYRVFLSNKTSFILTDAPSCGLSQRSDISCVPSLSAKSQKISNLRTCQFAGILLI